MTPAPLTNSAVAQQVHAAIAALGATPLDNDLPNEPSVGSLRRGGWSHRSDDVGMLTLLDVDGVLIWEEGAVNTSSRLRRRGIRGLGADGEVVTQVKYAKPLGLNSITSKLAQLDDTLTPNTEDGLPENEKVKGARLLEYDQKTWQAKPGTASPRATGRILLIIHGTFSNCGSLMGELRLAGTGPGTFLARVAGAPYDQVLGFDHFTISRSPFVNAVDLARRFANSDARIDIVCHSRGGLVARWFSEMLHRPPGRRRTRMRRIVFVGCPLQGTSLADPSSVRNSLNLLTNVGRVLGDAFSLVPYLAAASGLVQVLSSVGNFAAKSPIADAAIGLMPGIAAMSRTANNAELNALNHGLGMTRTQYFGVSSQFNANEVGWKFWRLFNKLNATDLAADYLVFEQENDLVVDTSSMTYHAFGPKPNLRNCRTFCSFDARSQVHHTAYFREPRTLEFIASAFGI
jgi:hypothetical protein